MVDNPDDIDMDSDSDSGSADELEADLVEEVNVADFENKVAENPFNYAANVALIEALRKCGEYDKLMSARQEMAQRFPLSPTLWLDWIKDLISADNRSESGRSEVEQLFERAIGDYQSIDIWLEYVQWACAGSPEYTRKTFDRAVTNVGLQADKGALLWDLWREFEIVLLQSLTPDTPKHKEHFERVQKLFRRQLSIPLIGMEQTWIEYRQFLANYGKQVDPKEKSAFESVLAKLKPIVEFEDAIESPDEAQIEEKDEDKIAGGENSQLSIFNRYIDHEMDGGDPARIQILFERGVTENCLDVKLWLRYVKWLDDSLKIHEVLLPVYARSVRNCPWSTELWRNYLLALERSGNTVPDGKIDEVWLEASSNGFTSVSEGIDLYITYIYLLKRRADASGDTADYAAVQKCFEDGSSILSKTFGERVWDPEATYRKCWAYFEAAKCANMDKAGRIWQEILASGAGPHASQWLEAVSLERQFGAVNSARKLFQKAVNAVSDWPQLIGGAYLQFEREEGKLGDLDAAKKRVDAQLRRVAERKKASTSEAKRGNLKPTEIILQPSSGTTSRKRKDFSNNNKDQIPMDTSNTGNMLAFEKSKKNLQTTETNSSEEFKRDLDGFAIPMIKIANKKARFVNSDYDDDDDNSGANSLVENNHDNQKIATKGRPESGTLGSTCDTHHVEGGENRTVFVSNLDFKCSENDLKDLFSNCGKILSVRLVRRGASKLHKGYGYVEFDLEKSAIEARKMDRTLLNGRPVFVSEYKPHEKGGKSPFKFGAGLQKSKIFVSNLNYEMTTDELREIFVKFGQLKDVRIVTHKSGKPKGHAYIEFVEEKAAASAVANADATLIQGRRIHVAISNPPSAKMESNESSFATNFASTARKGHSSKIQLIPRALARIASTDGSKTSTEVTNEDKNEDKNEVKNEAAKNAQKSLSNAEFRERFLLKK